MQTDVQTRDANITREKSSNPPLVEKNIHEGGQFLGGMGACWTDRGLHCEEDLVCVIAFQLTSFNGNLKGHCHGDFAVFWSKLLNYLTKNLFCNMTLLL